VGWGISSRGSATTEGAALGEPYAPDALTHPETLRGLVHRGGLIAEVLCDGELKVGMN
jgi:hypothetical protein